MLCYRKQITIGSLISKFYIHMCIVTLNFRSAKRFVDLEVRSYFNRDLGKEDVKRKNHQQYHRNSF